MTTIWPTLIWVYYLIMSVSTASNIIHYLNMYLIQGITLSKDVDGYIESVPVSLVFTILALIIYIILFIITFQRKRITLVLLPLINIIFFIISIAATSAMMELNKLPVWLLIPAMVISAIMPTLIISVMFASKDEYMN